MTRGWYRVTDTSQVKHRDQIAQLMAPSQIEQAQSGHFKTQFAEEGAAKKAAVELLAKYPMLQVEIYDASSKSRTLVK